MPSASSTVAVVESQPRGDRCHGGPRSLKGESPFVNAYQRVEPPSRPVWRKDNPSITSSVRLAHNASIRLLARDGRTMPSASSTVAVVESQRQGDPRHGGGRPPPRWAAVTQGGGALRIYISIVFIVRLAHTTSICSLARHGRTLPSANSTVAVVESKRRGDRRYGEPRSLKGDSPFLHHRLSHPLTPCLAQRYF